MLIKSYIYRESQKKESNCLYLRKPFSYKNHIYHSLHKFFKSFQLDKKFKNRKTKSADSAQYADVSKAITVSKIFSNLYTDIH